MTSRFPGVDTGSEVRRLGLFRSVGVRRVKVRDRTTGEDLCDEGVRRDGRWVKRSESPVPERFSGNKKVKTRRYTIRVMSEERTIGLEGDSYHRRTPVACRPYR